MKRDEMRDALGYGVMDVAFGWNGYGWKFAPVKAGDYLLGPESPLNMHAIIDGEVYDIRVLLPFLLSEHFGLLRRIKRQAVRDELTDEMRKALSARGWPDGLYDAIHRLNDEEDAP